MNKMKDMSTFQEFETKVWDHNTLKTSDPKTYQYG